MKRTRRFSALAIAFGLSISCALSACGSAAGQRETDEKKAEAKAETTAADEKTEEGRNTENHETVMGNSGSYADAQALLESIEIPGDKVLKIGYLSKDESIEYIAQFTAAIKSVAEKFGSQVELYAVDGQCDPAKQMNQAEDMIVKGVDACIISCIDRDAGRATMDKMVKAGIKVVVHEDPEYFNGACQTGTDFIAISETQVDMVAEALGGKGVINVLISTDGSPSSEYGKDGIHKGLKKYPGLSIGSIQAGKDDRATSMGITEDWIANGQNFDAIIALNDDMAIAASLALESAGVKDVVVIGIDGMDQAIELIKKGTMYGTIVKHPTYEGEASAIAAIAAAAGMDIEPGYYVDFTAVTPDNVDTFK